MAKPQKKRARRIAKAPAKKKSRVNKSAPANLPLPKKADAAETGLTIVQPVPDAPAPPKSTLNMCHGCSAGCCYLVADLTPFDIARIVHIEKKTTEEFVSLMKAKPDDRLAFRAQGGHFKIVLKRDGKKCCFLRDGPLKCEIEASKPAVCLVYPFSVCYGDPYIRREALCPKENRRRADFQKMSKETLDDCFYESGRYAESIRVWNRHAKGSESPEQFFAFVAEDIDADRSKIGKIRQGAARLKLMIGLR